MLFAVICLPHKTSSNRPLLFAQFRKVKLSLLLLGPNCPLATITSIKELINDQLHHSSDMESNRSMLLFGITTSALIKTLFKLALGHLFEVKEHNCAFSSLAHYNEYEEPQL